MTETFFDLLERQPPAVAFDGTTYEADQDHDRLKSQFYRVFQFMSDGTWRTLREISDECGGSEASVSARLRDLRKPQYGEREIQRERVVDGLWRYRMVPLNNTSLIKSDEETRLRNRMRLEDIKNR